MLYSKKGPCVGILSFVLCSSLKVCLCLFLCLYVFGVSWCALDRSGELCDIVTWWLTCVQCLSTSASAVGWVQAMLGQGVSLTCTKVGDERGVDLFKAMVGCWAF